MVMLANSPALRVDGVNAVSVIENGPATVLPVPVGAFAECRVVPHAAIPPASASGKVVPAPAAELVQELPVNDGAAGVPPVAVATNLTTTEFGRTPVSVLLIRSF